MFKYSKLILVILICLVTFSIGYALFTGNVSISSTAKLDPTDINISTQCGVIEYSNSLNEDEYYTSSSGVEQPVINCSGTNVQWSTHYLYPGASQGYWIEVTNNSNFDVKFKTIEVLGNDNNVEDVKENTQGVIYIFDKPKSEISSNSLPIDFELLEKNVSNSVKCSNNTCVLNSNNTFTLLIKEYVNSNITGTDLNMQASRTVKLGLEQNR